MAARAIYFGDRTAERSPSGPGCPGSRIATARIAYRAKTADALLLVERLRALPESWQGLPDWNFVASDPWRRYLAARADG